MQNINTSKVTPEAIDRCHRIVNEATGETYYKVENERGDVNENGDLIEYEVHFSKKHGFTCTCKCGQEGFKSCKKTRYCKHVTWSVAAAEEFRQEQAEQAKLTKLVNQGVSRSVAELIAYADEHPFQYSEAQIKRAQQANQRKPFSILR